jgi:hypothetical protein
MFNDVYEERDAIIEEYVALERQLDNMVWALVAKQVECDRSVQEVSINTKNKCGTASS